MDSRDTVSRLRLEVRFEGLFTLLVGSLDGLTKFHERQGLRSIKAFIFDIYKLGRKHGGKSGVKTGDEKCTIELRICAANRKH